MKINLLIDICPLLARRTGIGNYVFYLLREILQDEQVGDVVGVCGMRLWERHELEQLLAAQSPTAPNTSPVPAAPPSRWRAMLKHIPFIRELRNLLQGVRLYRLRARFHNYVFWGGNYALPMFWSGKSLLTIHDLSHVHYAEFHPRDRVQFLNRYLPQAMQRATVISVVSEATQGDVQASFANLALPPMVTVSPAVDECFLQHDVNKQAEVQQKYQLPTQFILSVGTLEPRKNTLRLLEAYSGLAAEVQAQWPLLLVGGKGWLTEEITASLQQSPNVRWLGYIPDEDMPSLYQCADIFAYISLFEGFGMPILEAMASGTAVITSDSSSMPEVAGDAAILVQPTSVASIQEGLGRLLQDAALRTRLSAEGRSRATQFNWHKSAKRMLLACNEMSLGRSQTGV